MAKSPRKRADPEFELLRTAQLSAADARSRPGLVPLVEDDSGHRFLVYASQTGIRIELRYEGDTCWASQA